MCRVLVLACRDCRSSSNLVKELVKALTKASRYDSRLLVVSGGARACHGDGWGYALAMNWGGSVAVAYDRFSSPIYAQSSVDVLKNVVSWIARSESCLALIHARAASRGEPLGSSASHPFMYRLRIGNVNATMFFAHNGGSDKDALLERLRGLGIDVVKHLQSDSYLLGLALAKELEGLQSADRRIVVEKVSRIVSTYCRRGDRMLGGVTSTLIAMDGEAFAIVTSWFSDEKAFYYQPMMLELRDLIAIASPTVMDFVAVPRNLVKPMANRTVALLDFEGLKRIDRIA